MKKLNGFLTLMLVFLLVNTSYGMVDLTVFVKVFVRGTGTPVTESHVFTGLNGQAIISLTNGGAEDSGIESVSSSEVCLNGTVIFDASNFNQNVTALEKSVVLNEGDNTLTVLLKSKPGGQIRIEIIQEVDADAAAVIGPEGGVVEVSDTSSPILGVRVDIVENAFPSGTTITVAVQDQPPLTPLPDGITQEGPCISFESSVQDFQGPVYIRLPFEGERQENEIRVVYTYNKNLQEWEPVVPLPTEDPSVFVAMVGHFSDYAKGKATITGTEKETSFQIGRDTLQFRNDGPAGFCVNDPDNEGVCAGLAILTTEYFNEWAENEDEGLMCRWDRDTSANAACEAYGLYYNAIGSTWPDFFGSCYEILHNLIFSDAFADYSYIIDEVKKNAKKNKVTTVHMWRYDPVRDKRVGHAVVVYGWRITGLFSGELKIYNANYNDREQEITYYSGLPPYIQMVYTDPVGNRWEEFSLDPLKTNVNTGQVIQQFEKTDADDDNVGEGNETCDECPNTPNGEPANQNGCSFTQLSPELSLPLNEATEIDPNNINFEWNPVTHPGGASVEYCITIKEDSSPDIPVWLGCDLGLFMTDTSFQTSLDPGKTYLWAVWAKDGNDDWSKSSEWWSFVTKADSDGDGVYDDTDNCPDTTNPDQADFDGDGDGDACDTDDDDDGVLDDQDAFPLDPTEWLDTDGDGQGDNADPDDDNDGVDDDQDAFPTDPNEWADSDTDNVGDNSDNCPNIQNADQADSDNDGIGDVCEGTEKHCFSLYQAIPTNGATDWESFIINGETYLAVANCSNGSSPNIDSKIYKWDGSSFIEFQSIPTKGGVHWESFTIDSGTYLAVANWEDDTTHSIDSKIYRWNGSLFEEIQAIPTYGAADWKSFTIDGETYLAVANWRNDNTVNIDSKIYKASDICLDNGLVAYYPFNGNANDESGNGNDGTVYGVALTTDMFGNGNSAYNFDGVDDYIEVFPNQELNPENGSFSYCFWVKTSEVDDNMGYMVGRYDHDYETSEVWRNTTWGIQFLSDQADDNDNGLWGYFRDGYSGENNFGSHKITETSAIADEQFHFIVAVRNIAEVKVKFYIDGMLVFEDSDTTSNITVNSPMIIGTHGHWGHRDKGDVGSKTT